MHAFAKGADVTRRRRFEPRDAVSIGGSLLSCFVALWAVVLWSCLVAATSHIGWGVLFKGVAPGSVPIRPDSALDRRLLPLRLRLVGSGSNGRGCR